MLFLLCLLSIPTILIYSSGSGVGGGTLWAGNVKELVDATGLGNVKARGKYPFLTIVYVEIACSKRAFSRLKDPLATFTLKCKQGVLTSLKDFG